MPTLNYSLPQRRRIPALQRAIYQLRETGITISFDFAGRRWTAMTPAQQCDVLGAVCAELRRLADEADEQRLRIASEELVA